MRTRRDRSSRPRTSRQNPLRGWNAEAESDFPGAVDAVRSCVLSDPSLLPDMGSRQAIANLMVGLVDLAVSLAAHAVGPDTDAIDALLIGIRNSDETIDLTSAEDS